MGYLGKYAWCVGKCVGVMCVSEWAGCEKVCWCVYVCMGVWISILVSVGKCVWGVWVNVYGVCG